MDDNDDAVLIEPDVNGFLDLTNRAWVNLDHRIWYSTQTLFVLDISYNNMFELPANIGDLYMLRELRASFNKLIKLPPTVGKLKRLRRLVLNGNKLKHLPDEIGRLDQCEELILSENSLQVRPCPAPYLIPCLDSYLIRMQVRCYPALYEALLSHDTSTIPPVWVSRVRHRPIQLSRLRAIPSFQ